MSGFDALLIDFGGVLTSSAFRSFEAFCVGEGLAPGAFADALRSEPRAARLLRDVEIGALREEEFERRFARLLGVRGGCAIDPVGLIARLTAGLAPDEAMLDALERVRGAGHATAVVSNSFGPEAYEGYDLDRRVDAVILSAAVGVRKPSRRIYHMAAERLGVAPERCVFVDDLEQNIAGAERTGMTGIHHVSTEQTVAAVEELFALTETALR